MGRQRSLERTTKKGLERKYKTLAGAVGALTGLCAAAWLSRNRRLFIVSDVTTGESYHYPELRAHVYFGDSVQIGSAAQDAVKSLTAWRLVARADDGATLFAEVENPFTGLLSDVFVTLVPLGKRHTRVVIRAKSRLSHAAGDLGDNARYIRQLQDRMDETLIGG